MNTSDLINLIFLSLVVWRLTYLVVIEDGPFMVFAKMRSYMANDEWLDIYCFYCASIWISLLVTIFHPQFIIYWLAVSAGSIMIHNLHERIKEGM